MPNHVQRSRSEAGFTLLELLISASIMVAVMTVVLAAIDMNANVTRIQTDVSDVQQSMRVAQREMQRYVRMAGRGGLPWQLAVDPLDAYQNVPANTTLGPDQIVVEGTDMISIRGAFNTPIYRVDHGDPGNFQVNGATATLVIDSITRSAFDQPMDALQELIDEDDGSVPPEPILLVGRQGESVYMVAELATIDVQEVTLDIQNQYRQVDRATLTLNVTGGHHTDIYGTLSSTPQPTSVMFATVLEEYRYYIREDFSIPGDDTSPPSPKLSRARMIPGTLLDEVHPGSAANDGIDIADNVFDLQVAYGIDVNGNGIIEGDADTSGTPIPPDSDEWRWNDEGDDDDPLSWIAFPLRHVRLTILGQTQTPDRTYIAAPIVDIEDRDYSENLVPATNDEVLDRRYRRRMLQSTVALRNL